MESSYAKLSVAPMIDVTNRFFRFIVRLMTKKTQLYTEMISENIILKPEK